MLSPSHLGRYKDVARLLVEHRHAGRGGLGANSDSDLEEKAERLASELEDLGPTFVKLGQLLSTRSDLLPQSYVVALSRLQDKVGPIEFEAVERIVTVELGVRLSRAFSTFDEKPLAAASLGQVHRAVLRDGRSVVVKVQRPDIRAQIVSDMEAIETIAEFADRHTEVGRQLGFTEMVEEFRRSLMDELDYRREASNLQAVGRNLAAHPLVVVPQPISDYTTGTVLTMDYVPGQNLGNVGPLALMEVDGKALAQALFSAYLNQILVDGLFHADPHPGNVMITDDGRLALIDLGMVARVTPQMQDSLLKLLLAISEGNGQAAADVAAAIGQKLDGYDSDQFHRRATELVSRNQGAEMSELQAGRIVGELTQISGSCGLRLPPELTMLGKALLNLDEIARRLDPTFDPNIAIQHNLSALMRHKLLQSASPANVITALMEAKEFATHLPAQLNKVMDALAEGELTLNVQGIDEREVMRSFQKLANRLTMGLVVASLVIGAALIMRIPTTSRLFGYPALAIVLFLLAAGAALWLIISIQLSDLPQHSRRHPRRRQSRR